MSCFTEFCFITLLCFSLSETSGSQSVSSLSPGSWINIAYHADNFSSWSLPSSSGSGGAAHMGRGGSMGGASRSEGGGTLIPFPSSSPPQSRPISLEDSSAVCARVPGLSVGQLRQCSLFADHMASVGRGAQESIVECQHQFRHHRWNCSSGGGTTAAASTGDGAAVPPALHIGSREAAFTHAIAAAGVAFAVARSCKDGSLASCGCSRTARPRELKREWLWGGCGDNLEYGYKFTQGFVDVRERERPLRKGSRDQGRALMNLHNNEAGRRAVIRASKVTCKCHGVSGSCSMITCWQQLTPFREIGEFLREKYDSATEVRVSRRGKLQVKNPHSPRPTVNDLVYLDESPNYCVRNPSLGSLGTQGRACNRSSRAGPDSCGTLCCGRGHVTQRVTRTYRCDCKFHWCCHVECRQCSETRELTTCK